MAEITASDVKALRDKSGAGMMDAKKALTEADGDMTLAIEILRKKGAAVANKRADREAKEGTIAAALSEDGRTGALVEANCETDFVARNDAFIGFATEAAELAVREQADSLEALGALKMSNGRTVSEQQSDLVGKIGEKIELRRVTVFHAGENGLVVEYIHPGARLGVLVELTTPAEGRHEGIRSLGRDVAMQVAAAQPSVVNREEVDQSAIAKEVEIYRQQAMNEGKPEKILDRIATGKLEKYYQDVALIEQAFVKDAGRSVREVVAEVAAQTGHPITVRRFARYLLGEAGQS